MYNMINKFAIVCVCGELGNFYKTKYHTPHDLECACWVFKCDRLICFKSNL